MTNATANFARVNRPKTPAQKTFFKEALGLTGMEVSWNELQEGESIPFLHKHLQNEEVYYCVSGQGQAQIDGQYLDFSEGTFVSVQPSAFRGIRNVGSTPLQYLCVQAKADSLSQWTRQDGVLADAEPKWPL
ncbi:MAG: cupin domain-containing protein [Cyanobacteria bacterium]|nr:cupin domain-containing protein [Cyanobacteriota bacterium]